MGSMGNQDKKHLKTLSLTLAHASLNSLLGFAAKRELILIEVLVLSTMWSVYSNFL